LIPLWLDWRYINTGGVIQHNVTISQLYLLMHLTYITFRVGDSHINEENAYFKAYTKNKMKNNEITF